MLELINISKKTKISGNLKPTYQKILDGISFSIRQGEMVGLVGKSGSGKSTIAKIACGIEKPDSGNVFFNGQSFAKSKKTINAVFQNYKESINPSMRVLDVIAEPLLLKIYHPRSTLQSIIAGLLQQVGLDQALMVRYIHELSGGQIQRICICRAIINRPEFIIFDEAISSLDIINQVQIIELLKKINQDTGIGFLFISHDIKILCNLCQRILFLNDTKIVEESEVSNLSQVSHSFSKEILNAVI